MIFNKNPGPGQYKESSSISEIAMSKAKNQSSVFASTLGKSWYSTQVSPNGSPRACAMAVPHSGEPYNEFGFYKGFNPKFNFDQDVQRVFAATKCGMGEQGLRQSKTSELMDFLKMNDRILHFKKRTVRNIEDATAAQHMMMKRNVSKDGSQYI